MSDTEQPKTDLEKKRQGKRLTVAQKGRTISDFINSPEALAKINEGAPKYLTAESITRVALTAMQKNQKLLDCTQGSILQALIDCAAYGLVPSSVTNEAHLIPFKDTCVLVVGYKGLIKMATNTGLVSHIEVAHVHENDLFTYALGLDRQLDHKPAITAPGEYVGSYAIVVFTSGFKDFRYVSKEEGLAHGKRFSKNFTRSDSTWKLDEKSMIAKTAVRMVLKYVPASPQSEKLTIAIARDEMLETRGYIDVEPAEKEEIPAPQPKNKEPDKEEKKQDPPPADSVDDDTGEIIPDELFAKDPTQPTD